ncbi:DUF7859 family protein [Haloarchaeobius amylolyticus]|uniref:DUF7859 family protein n=1 Tax=Haloarchaeobius amylolyticus TaxID=1198296 RepID=UPI002270C1C8|nr:hypothetical protein [Haloarchaeobius amylolyticus]
MQTPLPAQLGGLLEDPFTLLVVGFLLALIFFFYLMFRKTMLSFREGMDKGSGKKR